MKGARKLFKTSLAIDIDGVLSDTMPAIADALNYVTGSNITDPPTDHDLTIAYPWVKREQVDKALAYVDWLNLPVIEDAVDMVNALTENYDVHIITTRPTHARIPTLCWLSSYGFPMDRVHFVKPGEKHCLKVDIAIDDDPNQIFRYDCVNTMAIMKRQPWNDSEDTRAMSACFHNWNTIGDFLVL